MKQSRLLWRIYLYFLLATVVALAVVTGNAVRTFGDFHEEQVALDLESGARFVARDVSRYSLEQDKTDINRICKEISELAGARVTVILSDGQVVGDSEKNPDSMDNHADRPEIVDALKGATGVSTRFSNTLKQRLKYVAIPLEQGQEIVGVVRVSQPLAEIRWVQRIVSREVLIGSLFAAVLFAIVALVLSRRISKPLEEIRWVATQLAEGDLDARVSVASDDEIGALARTINQTAAQLGDRMDTITRQQVEQQAVLRCMVEGVLAVDVDGHILYLNKAAGELLGLTPEQARKRSVEETVRNPDLQEFISATLAGADIKEKDIVMRGLDQRHVQLHGAPLIGPNGGHIGGLVVINDITRMKRLERVRSDFVANVSHELKTPITALKGCVETLSDDDSPSPEDTSRFTAMMARHVSRLEAIVQDLLSLSRIEFETSRDEVQCEPTPVGQMLRRVIFNFSETAQAKNISVEVECPDDLTAVVNSALIEQAVGNLVDNALKYSDDGTKVNIEATLSEENQIGIAVTDQGPGVDQKHFPRIFERFYRIDKARSRALGGTGLGLSIVKHIALAHQGNVTIESATGEGTTFTLFLPVS